MFRGTLLVRAPLRVLVLTMTINGGAITPALRHLGFAPYLFVDTLRDGRISTHPDEWTRILRREKPFDWSFFENKSKKVNKEGGKEEAKITTQHTKVNPSDDNGKMKILVDGEYDALVGPPATAAFESIVHSSAPTLKVILIEEPDKEVFEQRTNELVQAVRNAFKPFKHFHMLKMVNNAMHVMTDLKYAFYRNHTAGLPTVKTDTIAIDVNSRKITNTYLPHNNKLEQVQGNVVTEVEMVDGQVCKHNPNVVQLKTMVEEFEEYVKATVPAEQLLVYQYKQGWEPLTSFLNVPIPTRHVQSTDHTESEKMEVVPFPTDKDNDAIIFIDQLQRNLSKIKTYMSVYIAVSVALLAWFVIYNYRTHKGDVHTYIDTMTESLTPEIEKAVRNKTFSLHELLIRIKQQSLQFYKNVWGKGNNKFIDNNSNNEDEELSKEEVKQKEKEEQ